MDKKDNFLKSQEVAKIQTALKLSPHSLFQIYPSGCTQAAFLIIDLSQHWTIVFFV